jgi:ABC-type nitrate/sulfonate/bicarbonate transport system substrate-binding protein
MAGHKKRNLIVTTVVVLIFAITLSSFVHLNSQKPYTGNIEPLTIGLYPSEYNSLIYIARDQQYFLSNGLDVTLKDYPSGSSAASGMLDGEVDISTASEFVVANNLMKNESLYAFGTVSKYLNVYLTARTDRAISSISDLEGKRIGVNIGTANQFFLGRFLEINGLNQSKVTIVNLNFADSQNALANGTVDAVVTNPPYTNQIQSLLNNRNIVWPLQSGQFGYFESICTKNWATSHPELIVRFLKALIQAENFNINNQDQAISLLSKDLNYTKEYTTSVWPDYQYSVTLDQSFVLLMQEEARWLISNNLTTATSVPNFLNNIYANGLKAVNPESVNIIGLGD